MVSKEIVQRTIDYDFPDRVACTFEPYRDLLFIRADFYGNPQEWVKVADNRWERKDEWGNTWARVEENTTGEIIKGALADIKDVYDYEFFDHSNPDGFKNVRAHIKKNKDKWVIGSIPFTFTVARKMFKLDVYLMNLLLEPEHIRVLHDKIDKIAEDCIVNFAEAGADSVMIYEDWGTQDRTLISPALWYEEFFPRFKRLCGIVHDFGMKFFMHSCGRIEAIVPDLIKAGVDVFQFDQPELHGIDKLASYQKEHKVTFWTPVDIQRTLQTRDESKIRSAAQELLDKLWQGRGGYIAGCYVNDPAIGLDPVWQEYAKDEFVRYGIKDNFLRVRNA